MRDIEQAGRGPDMQVLLEDAAVELHRHLVAGERRRSARQAPRAAYAAACAAMAGLSWAGRLKDIEHLRMSRDCVAFVGAPSVFLPENVIPSAGAGKRHFPESSALSRGPCA